MKMIKNLGWAFIALAVAITGCKKDKQDEIATLTTSSAASITATSAKLGGNVTNTGGTSLTSRGICWAIHSNPTITDSLKYDNGSTGAFTVVVTGLNANTVYYVRAFAINGTGTGYGDQITFTTSAGLATLTTTPIGTISPTSASGLSGGTIVNNGGATITASGVCWSTKANPTIASSLRSGTTASGSYVDTLKPLVSNTTYYYRAYATNSYGTAYGNQLTFTTSSTNTVVDIDGNVYYTITIGTQTWITSNLRVRHYQNGDPIVNGFTGFDLDNNYTTGAYTFANGDTTTAATYGLYYNLAAILDSRNIAPAGWHVSTDQDWYTLEFYEGLTASDTTANLSDEGFRGNIGGKFLVGGSSGLNIQNAGYYCNGCGGYQGFNQFALYNTTTIYSTDLVFCRGFNLSGAASIYRDENGGPTSIRIVKN